MGYITSNIVFDVVYPASVHFNKVEMILNYVFGSISFLGKFTPTIYEHLESQSGHL